MKSFNPSQPVRLVLENLSLERLDGEVIAIDFSTGKYASFVGPSADLIWLIQAGVPRERWFESLSELFPTMVDEGAFDGEVTVFLEELGSHGLIANGESSVEAFDSLPSDYQRTAWSTPVFAVEDDLADLLVIDPIHDVSGDGWPSKQ